MRHVLTGVDNVVSSGAVPLGMTLSIWCTGALLIDARSTPTVGQVFLFGAAAITGYGLLRIVSAQAGTGSTMQIGRSAHWVRAGVIHVASVGVTVGAAALLAQLETGAAWAIAPFAAVTLYFIVSSIEMALLDAEGYGEEG